MAREAQPLTTICIFAGSSEGTWRTYRREAEEFARELVKRQITVVYGGAKIGLMGVIADRVLSDGGQVIGVMPEDLVAAELAHEELTELHVVRSMHERKAMMAELSEAFISLPGGLGTLEEALEAATWTQLGIHAKPCGILNINGFFDPMLIQIERAVSCGFMAPEHSSILVSHNQAERLLDGLEVWSPPPPKHGPSVSLGWLQLADP